MVRVPDDDSRSRFPRSFRSYQTLGSSQGQYWSAASCTTGPSTAESFVLFGWDFFLCFLKGGYFCLFVCCFLCLGEVWLFVLFRFLFFCHQSK